MHGARRCPDVCAPHADLLLLRQVLWEEELQRELEYQQQQKAAREAQLAKAAAKA